MTKLLQSFFSFEKLMKEKLVVALFWLAIINFTLLFVANMLDSIGLDPLGWPLTFARFFVSFVMTVVAVRLLCEVVIAVFRINDNLSPDGGKSETADIDLIKETLKAADEARKAAEDAAKKATTATRSVVGRGRAHDKDDDDYKMSPDDIDHDKDVIIDAEPSKAPKATTQSKATPKKAAPKKTSPKKPTAKKAATSKSKANETATEPKLKKDGTPRKKPGPKPKT